MPERPTRSIRTPRRTPIALTASREVATVVKERLGLAPEWSHFTRNGSWICPFCLACVRGSDASRGALVRAVEGHLARRCSIWQGGAAAPQSTAAIAGKRLAEDVAHLAASDPAWQVFDHEGYWYSPCSLQRVPSVRIANGRFDSFTIQHMVAHLESCVSWKRGIVHPVETVQRARDQHLRALNLTFNLRQLVQFPLWRYADPAGSWICPFCLGHIPSVVLRTAADWQQAPERMAQHLAFACDAYVPERPEAKAERLVQQAAATSVSGAWRPPTAPPVTGGGSGSRPGTRFSLPVDPGPTVPPTRTTTRLDTRALPPTAPPVARPATGGSGARPVTTVTSGPRPTVPLPPAAAIEEAFAAMPDLADAPPAIPLDEPMAIADAVPISDVAPIADTVPVDAPTAAEPAPAADDDSLAWMDAAEQHGDGEAGSDSRADTERMRARQVQQGMLQAAPEIPGFRFATGFHACSDVSGDFYVFIPMADGRIGFAQGDVSGHGLHAGLIMSMAKKTLEIYARAGQGPRDTLVKVNDSLVDDLGGKIFVSVLYAVLDPEARTITWVRAGHSPVIHHNLQTGATAEIKPKGMVVGMKKGEIFRNSLEEQVTTVADGDLFLVYTDGITEAMNRQQEEFGVERLTEVVRKHAEAGPDAVLSRIMDSVRQFRASANADDDCTLLALAVDAR